MNSSAFSEANEGHSEYRIMKCPTVMIGLQNKVVGKVAPKVKDGERTNTAKSTGMSWSQVALKQKEEKDREEVDE
jgi:hypothetical protein